MAPDAFLTEWHRIVRERDATNVGTKPAEVSAEARHGGIGLHADVSVPARDRRRLERFCRYVARPPLANERLRSDRTGRSRCG